MARTPLQHQSARPRRHAGAVSRRGLTLLEILLAVTMLVLVTTSITAAISAITAMEARSRKRVAACELANRLILQYLDEEEALPSSSLPLDYGKDRYFYELTPWQSRMEINRRQQSSGSNLQGLARYKVVRVTVYEAEEDGEYPIKGQQLASIERIFDPATARNPDTIAKLDQNAVLKMINSITGGQAPTPPAPAPSGGGGAK